jgi:O-acetyl-ADP-ribose deacetylase
MDADVLCSIEVAGAVVEAVLGDLTEERVDAVVNAANSHLAHGGGLAAAIVRRGGLVIQQESDRLAPVAVGHAAATTAGALPARWVIHAVGPRWGEGAEEEKLRSAVRSSLDAAAELGAGSVAIPAISTGIFGYPKEDGTRTIVDEVLRWLQGQSRPSITHVRLTAFDQPTAGLFAEALKERTGQKK